MSEEPSRGPSRGRAALFWVIGAALTLGGVELALRAVLFQFPRFGVQGMSYHLMALPPESMPPSERSPVSQERMTRLLGHDRWRAIHPDDDDPPPPAGDLTPHMDLLWTYDPDHPYRVVSNNMGVRRRGDLAYEKPPGTRRIYCLGDSFTFGPYLSNEETYPELLEQILARSGGPVETMNAGIPGYGLLDEGDLLIHRGFHARPDLVVWQVLDNDLLNAQGSIVNKSRTQFGVNLRPTDHPELPPPLWSILTWANRHAESWASARLLWGLYHHRVVQPALTVGEEAVKRRDYLNAPQSGRDEALLPSDAPEWRQRFSEGARFYHGRFVQLLHALRERQTRLLVVFFPSESNLEQARKTGVDQTEAFYRALTRYYGVPYLDLTSTFLQEPDPRRLYLWPWNGHLSAWGNFKAAEAIAAQVEPARQGPLPLEGERPLLPQWRQWLKGQYPEGVELLVHQTL
ncbi:MAG: SGNH/GDSL hydrolase family protein [Magnetococcales bacterium]|nr:SGNH/GDSL hydrolase family protein [Magnetococcales bacterium]